MVIVVALIVAVVISVIRFLGSQSSTFLNGVYVNGVSLSGYSLEEGNKLVKNLADQRLNQNAITLTYEDKSWTLTPSMLGATMDVTAELAQAWNFGHTGNFFQRRSQQDYLKSREVAFNSELKYDEALLDQYVAMIKSEIDVPPVNATVTIKTGETLEISESKDGLALDGNALREALAKVIVEGSAPQIQLVAQVFKPAVSTSDLQDGTQLIGTCTTSTKSSTRNRTSNIHTALKKFNGFPVHPNETIYFNKVVGRRTVENGFKEAPEFAGTTVQQGIGGGVCQASTTLYNALLRAGMTVEQRWQHTMVVGYIDSSLDATVSESGKDLVFTNNTDSTIYIYTTVDTERSRVNIYGKRPPYEIRLESEILQDSIASETIKKKKDTSGKHAYYTDDQVLASEGKLGRKSRAFICYYDWETGELVERDELHTDYYYPSPPVYWVGIHEREEGVIP